MGMFEKEFAGNNEWTENERTVGAMQLVVAEVYLIMVFHGQR